MFTQCSHSGEDPARPPDKDQGLQRILPPKGSQARKKYGLPAKDGSVTAVVDAPKCAKCNYFRICKPSIHVEKATAKTSVKQKNRTVLQRLKGADVHSAIGRCHNRAEAQERVIRGVLPGYLDDAGREKQDRHKIPASFPEDGALAGFYAVIANSTS